MATVGDVAQRGGDLVEREGRADVRHDAPGGQEIDELGLVAAQLVGRVQREVDELEAEHVHALESTEIERDAAGSPRRELTVT